MPLLYLTLPLISFLLENLFLVVYIKLEKPSLSMRGLVNIAIVILALSNLD